LIVSREDAEPASRIPGRGAGTAGFAGRGFGVGSWYERGSGRVEAGFGAGRRGGGILAAALATGLDDAVRALGS